jgi:hypothetical protein
MLKTLWTVLHILALALFWGIAFSVLAGALLPMNPEWTMAPEASSQALIGIALQSLINTAIASYIILRSRWSGLKLAAAIFLLLYGAMTVLSQIETAAFPAVAGRLPPGFLVMEFVLGAILSAVFAPVAVFVLGKWRPAPGDAGPNDRLLFAPPDWLWRLAAVAAVYMVLYFTFGYFIAWRNPAVHQYYGGTDPGSFALQLANVARETPWLFPFQALRGLIWVAVALPVIRAFKGGPLETGIAIGLAYAMFMNSSLLTPNPIMPDAVRTAHFIETASSNFIYGVLVGWLFSAPLALRRPGTGQIPSFSRRGHGRARG